MNCGFGSNALLANTALILLCNIRRVFVVPCSRRQLFGCQADLYRIPKIALPLSQTHKRIAPKEHLNNIKSRCCGCRCCRRRRGRQRLEMRQHTENIGLIG